MIVDLRSDTVTKPTPSMLEAMFAAIVGDDVYEEDETVNQLEAELAQMFGMEAGLFCPSGTMTNQIAIKCLTQPLDEVICEEGSHVYRYEGGGIAFNSAASVRLIKGDRGRLTAEQIESAINPSNIHYPHTRLVVLENTSNRGGGSYYTASEIEPIYHLCRLKNLYLHLDGARIFNALVETHDDPKKYGHMFDSISICLSKGLGAPVGSVLIGSTDLIRKARRVRKAFGGGMRQAGYLAAAGLYALEHNIARLKEDHEQAKRLGQALQECHFVKNMLPVDTNIIIADLIDSYSADNFVNRLADHGIKCGTFGHQKVRFVTHLGISSSMIDYTIDILRKDRH
ncbi:low specificity L-threonine aldolase [Pedobacter sp. SYSU D00535]|uniref:threonine aldolase family protein n=1 Tax=Pedobacter sp. SYSU D00535 TaxID=2810308 RepID=UPI001A96D0C0|nr:GntG family PLP-dependent aldolase [Pedobacter sp. SYSU D00535]